MADRGAPLRKGKLSGALLDELLRAAAAEAPDVLLGPRTGEDAAALRVGDATLVVAADPITLTGAGVGAHAVVINANDVAVMGAAPRWFLATVLLPDGTADGEARALFEGMRGALDALGAVLVGGHTEVTDAVRQPVVAGQMLGVAPERGFVPTGGVRPGHAIVQVGPAPVEGAAVLAAEAAARLSGVDPSVVRAAADALDDPGISVVEPALAAAELGATALHDPTEGGLATGLAELGATSAVRLVIERDAVRWFEPGVELCRALDADPWGTLASGALLAAFAAPDVDAALEALRARGHDAVRIGRAEPGAGLVDADGAPLPQFAVDELSRVLA